MLVQHDALFKTPITREPLSGFAYHVTYSFILNAFSRQKGMPNAVRIEHYLPERCISFTCFLIVLAIWSSAPRTAIIHDRKYVSYVNYYNVSFSNISALTSRTHDKLPPVATMFDRPSKHRCRTTAAFIHCQKPHTSKMLSSLYFCRCYWQESWF